MNRCPYQINPSGQLMCIYYGTPVGCSGNPQICMEYFTDREQFRQQIIKVVIKHE